MCNITRKIIGKHGRNTYTKFLGGIEYDLPKKQNDWYAVLAQRCLFTGRRVASVYGMELKSFTV